LNNVLGSAWIDAFIARERLPPQFRALVGKIHAPIAEQLTRAARQHGGTLTVGLCGSQGSGKSTMAEVLKAYLDAQGLPTAVLSIDDLYYTRAERIALAKRIHPLFRTRGVPGTHDVALGVETIAKLRQHKGGVALPAFDKENDDRRSPDTWPVVPSPVSVVILEGWCVGAWPQDPAKLETPINSLERDEDPQGIWRQHVNYALAGEYRELFGPIDQQILLKAPSFDVVYGWRLEQEHKLRDRVSASGGNLSRVMSDVGIARFISHYERLTRHILAEMPGRADIVLELDAERAPARLLGA
jgi:D-glycerate 3-kinase